MKKFITTSILIATVCVAADAQSANKSTTQTTQTLSMQAPQSQTASQDPTTIPYNQLTQEQKDQRLSSQAERRAKYFEKEFSLSPMQYKGVYDACLQFVKDQQAFRDNGKQPNREENISMMDVMDAKLKKVMTTEQYTKYAATIHRPQAPNKVNTQQSPAQPSIK